MKYTWIKQWPEISGALLLYVGVLIYQGYLYGQGDQSQILPCLYAQQHPGAYPFDQYVQYYLHSGFNERTIFHFVFRWLGFDVPYLVFIWHGLVSLTLILAWLKISSFLIRIKAFQILAVGFILIIGFHTSTGANEIYYNSFIPSLPAKALGSWALVCWLTNRFRGWSILLILSTLLQPLVGLQLFLLTTIAYVLDLIVRKKIILFPWKDTLIYLVFAVPLLYFLVRHNGAGGNPAAFMEIMQFRLSHHFFGSTFGFLHLFAASLFAILTISTLKQRLRWFVVLIVVGCLVYELGAEFYSKPVFLYTQWWKTTIWMEAFAFILIGVQVEKVLSTNRLIARYAIGLPILFVGLIAFYRLSGIRDSRPVYDFPWLSASTAEVDISQKAEQVTSPYAVFIVPIEFTAFRWYSKRSEYVDYKAMLHQEAFLQEWYARIQQIYQFNQKDSEGGFDIHNFSYYLLQDPSPMSFEYWKKLGITHIVSTNPNVKGMTPLATNGRFTVYGL